MRVMRVLRARVRPWAVALIVVLLLVLALAGLWAASRSTSVALGGARASPLIPLATLLVSIAALGMPLLLRHLARRDTAQERHRIRDRRVMLARVRYRWITGVLDQSLAEETRISLGLTRRPDIVRRPAMIRQRSDQPEPLPAGTSLTEVFGGLGGGLLILGAPGSGKTIALLELARDLLDDAEADREQPMPVVLNLSSWATTRAPLAAWLVDELAASYDVPRRDAQQWVEANEILPLLDGLDEVAPPHRRGCVEAINAFCHDRGLVRFVVCSRTGGYADLATLLRVEEAVEQQPLSGQQIRGYLAAAGNGLAGVQAALQADERLWELLSCPLVLNIAALTYQGQPADALRAGGNPAQRLERLFAAYIERMLAHRPGHYRPVLARRWLGWLARSMRGRDQSEFHLDRLASDWLPTKNQRRLAAALPAMVGGPAIGLVFGLVSGLLFALLFGLSGALVSGLVDGLLFGLAYGLLIGLLGRLGAGWRAGLILGLAGGLVCGLIFGLASGLTSGLASGLVDGLRRGGLAFGLLFGFAAGVGKTEPAEQVRWSWKGLVAGLRNGLVYGLGAGLILGLVYGLVFGWADGSLRGLVGALAGALIFGPIGALAFGLIGGVTAGLTNERSTPNEGIHRSARHALFFGLFFGLAGGLPFGLANGLFFGLFFGPLFGLGFGGLPCLRHLTVRGLLAAHGFAPLRYVRFLDEAADQLFLRRVGSGYIFVHRLLLDHFADQEPAHPLP